MSRYDYPDPGQDEAYCNGLAHEDDDGEPMGFVIVVLHINERSQQASWFRSDADAMAFLADLLKRKPEHETWRIEVEDRKVA